MDDKTSLIKLLSKGLAHDILCSGSAIHGKATRIELRVGDGSLDTSNEKSNGGLCEQALIGVILDSLRKQLGN